MARAKPKAVASPLAVVGNTVPAYIDQQSAKGNENVGREDLVIPRIELVQALSPCLDENDGAYIEGSKMGQMFNTVTRQIYRPPLTFVPVYYYKEWLCWRDRKQGGGFGGSFASDQEARAAIQDQEDPENWESMETGQHLVLALYGDKIEEVMLSMSRTKLKVSRQFNSMIKLTGGDRFSRAYQLDSVEAKNPAGEKYRNFGIKAYGFPAQKAYEHANKLYLDVFSGDVVIEADRSEDGGSAAESSQY
jgi:hypothetical protein